jgi:lysophospholipase L1-like esterase
VPHLVGALRPHVARLTVYNLGVRGDTSRHIARRWRRETETRLPDIEPGGVVFMFGLNDCIRVAGVRKVSARDSPVLVDRIVMGATGWRPCFFIGPAPVLPDNLLPGGKPGLSATVSNGELAEMSEVLRHACARADVPYLDLFELLATSPAWNAGLSGGDGVHPRGGGYLILAETIGASKGWHQLVAQLGNGEPSDVSRVAQ